MGKGSKPRPPAVTETVRAANWDQAFGPGIVGGSGMYFSPYRRHEVKCEEYHIHTAPDCCTDDCWCQQ